MFCTIPHVDSADKIPERGGRLGAARRERFEGVTVKYRLTPQPQHNGTTLGLACVSVALRISLSVPVRDLTGKEKGAD